MKVIAIISQKGGVAKTTTAATLAELLAAEGHRVLCIDLNEQGDLTDTMQAQQEGGGVLELFTGGTPAKLLKETNITRVEMITGGEPLALLEGKIKEQGKARALILAAALKPLRRSYRYCIIDTPGNFNTAMLNALGVADSIVIPAQADFYSLKGIGRLIKNIRYVKENINPKLRTDGILLTRYQGRRNLSRETVEVLQEAEKTLGAKLFETKIRETTKIAECPGHHTTVTRYAPNSNGAEDYRVFYREFMKTLEGKD